MSASDTTDLRAQRAGVQGKMVREGLFLWDNHACFPFENIDKHLPELEVYRKAGFSVISLNVGYANMTLDEHLATLRRMRAWIARHPDRFVLISSVDDIRKCQESGRLGVTFDIEGMVPVTADPRAIQQLHALGVRWMLIAYNRANDAGGGCLETDSGLTARGREVITAMERAGMVLCVSHTGALTADQAMAVSTQPVILSHSNCAAVFPHPRNVSDRLIRMCAATGGVIGLNGFGPFLGDDRNFLANLMLHIKHLLDLVGPDHIGLGLDYVLDQEGNILDIEANPHLYPAGMLANYGFVGPNDVPELLERMSAAGLSDEEIAKIAGKNWLRVAETAWTGVAS